MNTGLVTVLVAVGLAGGGYGLFLHWLARAGYDEGYRGFLTVPCGLIGVGGMALLRGGDEALLMLGLLVACAWGSILGDAVRYIRDRTRERALKEAAAIGSLPAIAHD